ncbi:penicillin acylase family protein [Microbacterium ulmi]|uniref:Penicillin acylase family protein n=1 Tax=Microbacterium ulmi TaxID=179095 RepID=A0A7Y2M229_9MICO|nr:penicillin acylase family protein [Microbacterium ulmi]NII69487.1 penicillin amidase [Microbacterium ulmi]NNH04912.1 penicillin acylase family protein [Microbacterium ulmi]
MSKPPTGPVDLEQRRRPSVGRIIGIGLFSLVAGVTVMALVAAGVLVWTVQRSFPQLDGEVTAAGLDDTVTVQRDVLGIPSITADTTHDLFYAQGYVHAQDRFWEMDFRRHVTSGRVSELFGQSQLGTDMFLRTLGWHEIAAQEVEALGETERSYYDAYTDGVNAYLSDHDGAAVSLEYAVLGLQNSDYEIEKWTPADSVAWLKAMAWDLRSNVESETERALLAPDYTAAQLAELYPSYPFDRNPVIVPKITAVQPAGAASGAEQGVETAAVEWTQVDGVIEAVSALVGDAGEGIGSNSWVVSGDLTDTGLPLLANDPHLGASLPSVWHQIGLHCRVVSETCPFDVAGFGFSGVPGVVIGHNASIAWGLTNLTTDVTDLYLEKVDGDAYWRDGSLVPLEQRTETIEVAGGEDVALEIRSTVHGPIISGLTDDFTAIADDPYAGSRGVSAPPSDALEGEYAVSLQWTALAPGTTPSAIFALNVAQDFAGFREAARKFDVPAQNLVYADVAGNIGYQAPGRLPIRGAGDGSLPQPGWDSAYDWRGYIPFDELPVSYNPPEGYIVTANNAIVDTSYPYLLTDDWDYGWRAARITDLIQRKSAAGKLTASDLRDIQADTEFWFGKRLIAAVAGLDATGGEKRALDLLAQWDARNDAESAAAAYANVVWDELVQNLFVRGREHPAPLTGQGRLFLVVDELLGEPESPWWTNRELGIDSRHEMLEKSAKDAYARLAAIQGENPARWSWGELHAITLTSDTFGSSGIAPIEWLFNRGPFAVGGGSSVVDATGWDLGSGGFDTITVPSMRMIVDLSDLDASRWNHLTGASGHAFHPNYIDQTGAWQRVELTPWPFSKRAVDAATTNTLVLTPAG